MRKLAQMVCNKLGVVQGVNQDGAMETGREQNTL
jgi:hypothetical protein